MLLIFCDMQVGSVAKHRWVPQHPYSLTAQWTRYKTSSGLWRSNMLVWALLLSIMVYWH